jgi:hypothetical protein
VIVTSVADRRRAQAGRRSRQASPRPHLVKFFLTDEELGALNAAASQAGLARGAFAAQSALTMARDSGAQDGSPLRAALVELMRAAGLARRIGVNLNQAVARLNSTSQPGEDLAPVAQMCGRVVRRLDDAAEQVRRSIP